MQSSLPMVHSNKIYLMNVCNSASCLSVYKRYLAQFCGSVYNLHWIKGKVSCMFSTTTVLVGKVCAMHLSWSVRSLQHCLCIVTCLSFLDSLKESLLWQVSAGLLVLRLFFPPQMGHGLWAHSHILSWLTSCCLSMWSQQPTNTGCIVYAHDKL